MKKSFQVEIFQECNNLCDFCYLGKDNRNTPKEIKIKSLNALLTQLENFDIEQYNNISFIGGEFFQGQLSDPEVKDLFMQVMRKTHGLIKSRQIESVWLTATLTLGDQKDLYEVLDLFKDVVSTHSPDGLWICTSWDTRGRFHIPEMLTSWQHHMRYIHQKYQHVKFNTTIILSSWFIQDYLDGKFSFEEFSKEYHTTFFFKQTGVGEWKDRFSAKTLLNVQEEYMKQKQRFDKDCPGMFPERQLFLKFLTKVVIESSWVYEKLFNIIYRADILIKNYNEEENMGQVLSRDKDSVAEDTVDVGVILNKCGHIIEYAGYIDSDRCMLCDRNNIWEQIKGTSPENIYGKKEQIKQTKLAFLLEDMNIHDAASFIIDEQGQVLTGIEEERLTRVRHSPVQKGSSKLSAAWCKENIEKDYKIIPSTLGDVPHHLLHAWSAWSQCDFDEAVILVIDGYGDDDFAGEKVSTSIYTVSGDNITLVKKYLSDYSLGMLYSMLGNFCRVNGDCGKEAWIAHQFAEGKVMGLAAYGKINEEYKEYFDFDQKTGDFIIKTDRPSVNSDVPNKLIDAFVDLFGVPDHEKFSIKKADIAATGQAVFEFYYFALIEWILENVPFKNLVITGGCALNATANGKLLRKKLFDRVFIPPMCSDAGNALGIFYEQTKKRSKQTLKYNKKMYSLPRGMKKITPLELVLRLHAGKIIAWFEDGSEYGPRALCHRSLLAHPKINKIKYRINEIKGREYWRPLAPVVLESAFYEIFQQDKIYDPHYYMLATEIIKSDFRDDLKAVCGVDNTSRPQVLLPEDSFLHKIMTDYGILALVNTSLNVKGEAICETPDDAIRFAQKFDDVDLVFVKGEELFLWK